MIIAYIEYIYNWYKKYGLTTKNQTGIRSTYLRSNTAIKVFLNPLEFYKEIKTQSLWRKIANRKLQKCHPNEKIHNRFTVIERKSWFNSHDKYLAKRKLYGEENQLTLKSISERLYPNK